MDLLSEFTKICTEYNQFREAIVEAIALSDNENEQQALIQLTARLDHSLAEAKRELPRELARIQQELADSERATEAMKQQIAEAEEAVAKAAEPPPPPAPAGPAAPEWTDFTLAADLERFRGELLGLLSHGKTAGDAGTSRDAREIWQDWSHVSDE